MRWNRVAAFLCATWIGCAAPPHDGDAASDTAGDPVADVAVDLGIDAPHDATSDDTRDVGTDTPATDDAPDTGFDAGVDTRSDDVVETDVADAASDAAPSCDATLCGAECIDTQTDPRHCGDCAHDCSGLPHVTPAVPCVSGWCVTTGACSAGYADCDSDPGNGCETDLSVPTNCGACGTTCSAPANGTATCGSTMACGFVCNAGFHACGTTCADDHAITSCGASCAPCPTRANATPTCDGSACGYTCAAGFADCDGLATNGCETDLSSPSSCASCGNICTAPANATASCGASMTCSYACNAGFRACSTSCVSFTSPTNCGACGVVCNAVNASGPSCNGTTCSYTCNVGHSDCNRATAPDSDGCECATPACCGSSCQTTHANGVGQSFYDCTALNTRTATNALEACTAYATSIGGSAANCSDGWTCSPLPGVSFVCYETGVSCSGYCWIYSGTQAGSVTACSACTTRAGTWN